MGSLLDVRSKFDRACEHDETGRAMLGTWLNTKPYGVTAKDEEGAGGCVVRFRQREAAPRALANVFADTIHNLRACLDHIVCYLVEANNGDCGNETGFPVVVEERDWPSAVGSRLKGFPTHWLDVVKDAQPFNYGTRARQHPLYLLHHLDIRSKHRTIMPIKPIGFEWEPQFVFNRPPRAGDDLLYRVPPGPVEFEDGTEVMRVRAISKENDLRAVGIQNPDDFRVLHGHDVDIGSQFAPGARQPNMLVFVGSVIEAIAPAFESSH